jgi:hypothetical protein
MKEHRLYTAWRNDVQVRTRMESFLASDDRAAVAVASKELDCKPEDVAFVDYRGTAIDLLHLFPDMPREVKRQLEEEIGL